VSTVGWFQSVRELNGPESGNPFPLKNVDPIEMILVPNLCSRVNELALSKQYRLRQFRNAIVVKEPDQ